MGTWSRGTLSLAISELQMPSRKAGVVTALSAHIVCTQLSNGELVSLKVQVLRWDQGLALQGGPSQDGSLGPCM